MASLRETDSGCAPPKEASAAGRRAVRKVARIFGSEDARDGWVRATAKLRNDKAHALQQLSSAGVDLTAAEAAAVLDLGSSSPETFCARRLAKAALAADAAYDAADQAARADLYERHYGSATAVKRGRARVRGAHAALAPRGVRASRPSETTFQDDVARATPPSVPPRFGRAR